MSEKVAYLRRILFLETQNGRRTLQKEDFSYRTIVRPSEGLYREKGSRFLAFAYPVLSEAEISAHLSFLHKKYFDARHHCYAWMLGTSKKTFRTFDDGEPGHSAGDPILGRIRSRELTNILIGVVRYFGGTKLGIGGLITAYRSAADDALKNAEIVQREMTESITIEYDYAATPEVMKLIKDFHLVVTSQNFGTNCVVVADYKLRDRVQLFQRLDLMLSIGIKLKAIVRLEAR